MCWNHGPPAIIFWSLRFQPSKKQWAVAVDCRQAVRGSGPCRGGRRGSNGSATTGNHHTQVSVQSSDIVALSLLMMLLDSISNIMVLPVVVFTKFGTDRGLESTNPQFSLAQRTQASPGPTEAP